MRRHGSRCPPVQRAYLCGRCRIRSEHEDDRRMYPLKPILNRIVIRPDPEITQVGSILVPPIAKVDSEGYQTGEFVMTTGTVLAAGPGVRDKKGNLNPVQLKAGDRVEFRRCGDGGAGVELEVEGEKVLIMREDDVVGRYA